MTEQSQQKMNGDLIDTLWNVKNSAFAAQTLTVADLIDTLWNVKAGQKRRSCAK